MIRRKTPDSAPDLAMRRNGAAEPQEMSEQESPVMDTPPGYTSEQEQDSCGCDGAGLPLLTDVCETEDDVLAICILRFVLAGYCHDRAQCFDAAVDAAAAVRGEQYGLTLMTRAMGVVRALKAERNGNFCYLPANCCRISEDEQELVAAMIAMRSEDPVTMADAVTCLGCGEHAPRIMQAVWAFSMTAHTLPEVVAEAAVQAAPRSTLH